MESSSLQASDEEIAGFETFLKSYKKGLAVEREAAKL